LVNYVSSSSDHTQTILKANPVGVLEKLAKLTTMFEEKEKKMMVELYPANVNALVKAGFLNSNKILTLLEVISDMNKPAQREAMEERKRDYYEKRNIFFLLAVSKL